jgi:WD40 repeat protein
MILKFHEYLSRYFASKPLYLDESTHRKPNCRKLIEQPWQQTRANMWGDLEQTLCNLLFIEEKCHVGLTNDLLEDFNRARQVLAKTNLNNETIGSERWNQWENFVKREAENFLHFATTFPQIVFQQAYNSPYHPVISKATKEIEYNGNAPEEPWFKIYEVEPSSLKYVPPILLRKPISEIRKTIYQDITSLAVINPTYVVSGYLDGMIAIWNIESCVRLHFSKAHSWKVQCILPINEILFATGGSDGIIKIWDIEKKMIIRELHGHTGKIWCMKKWEDRFIISGSTDKTIRIWDLNKTSESPKILSGHEGTIVDLVIVEEKYLISISSDNTFGFWDLGKRNLIARSIKYTWAAEHSITFSSSGDIYSYGVSGVIYWGELKTILKKSLKEKYLNLVREINPTRLFDTQGMNCMNVAWISDHEILILDLGKIFKLNIVDSQLTTILDSDGSIDFNLGLLQINDTSIITWNKNGGIWKWDLHNMERENIAILSNGEPFISQILDNETILIGTRLSEEIYIVKLNPKNIDSYSTNFRATELIDPGEYPIFSYLKEAWKKDGTEISDKELLDLLKRNGSFSKSYESITFTNSRRDNWVHEGCSSSNTFDLDVRNFYIYLLKDGKECAVLPGVFHICFSTGTRFEATDISGLKYWIELINV